jgi:hypothetical protein
LLPREICLQSLKGFGHDLIESTPHLKLHSSFRVSVGSVPLKDILRRTAFPVHQDRILQPPISLTTNNVQQEIVENVIEEDDVVANHQIIAIGRRDSLQMSGLWMRASRAKIHKTVPP